ncbi:MAG TPA: dihydrolipoyl dehydrogenase [Chthonomonadales bacterium]|nr:dihydrolipoyl dehydrogenase [Chthonomonadales bacterium]
MSQPTAYDVDVLVIGSGPGGYVCAVRAAQLGARTAIVERNAREWGGVCLNWGCIPTKTLIASVERLHAVRDASRMGIRTGEVGFDFAKVMERKDKVVSTLRGGVEALLKSNQVTRKLGRATLAGPSTVTITTDDGTQETVTARNIVLATGSRPVIPPVPGLEGDGVWTSNEALTATAVPKSMLLIGAGAVGLEFAYIYSGFGCTCTVVEMLPQILPLADAEIGAELRRSLKKQGIECHTNARINKVERRNGLLSATVATEKGDVTIEAEVIVVGAGRRPNVEDLGLETAGVEVAKPGIVVNERMQTTIPGVYAIGDCTGKLALAHVASHQGIVAAENAMGHDATMDYRTVPSPVFTDPEVGWVGMTEAQAREAGYEVQVGKFPFRPLGKAMAMNRQDGLVKIVSERKYGEILGVHIVGPHASDLIHEAVAAMRLEATVKELMEMVHAHPTLAEAIMEASLDVEGRAIHKLRP